MQRLVWVIVISGLVGCRSGTATFSGTLGLAFAVTGNALLVTADGDRDQRTVAFISLGVATYLLAMSALLEGRATERESVARASASPWAEPATPSIAAPRGSSSYDRTGAYGGRVDEQGNVYDRTGAYAGRIDPRGAYFDRIGAPAGRVDNDQYYDRTGAPAGRIDAQGQYYDRTGAPAGRIDGTGAIYDRTGAYAGRVDGSCDAECRRTTAGQILLAPPK